LVDKALAEEINGSYKPTMERKSAVEPAEEKPKPRPELIRAREKLDKQQADMAAEFKVTQATISHWETGSATPHYSRWQEVSDRYGVPLKKVIAMFTGGDA
jgi:DNA-binding transcriptional regulator YiaG